MHSIDECLERTLNRNSHWYWSRILKRKKTLVLLCWMDPFGKINANFELAMVKVLVSPKNTIILRFNFVCEGILCGSVWLY